MADFFANKPLCDLEIIVPRAFYVQDDSESGSTVRIAISDKLLNFFKCLEALECSKWQIEGLLLQLVQDALQQRLQGVMVNSLCIQTILAGRAGSGPRCLPCSKGLRIITSLGSPSSLAALESSELRMNLPLFALILLSFSSWEHLSVFVKVDGKLVRRDETL